MRFLTPVTFFARITARITLAVLPLCMPLAIIGCADGSPDSESASPTIQPKLIRQSGDDALVSIDLGAPTISKVRSAVRNGGSYIVASTYEGTLIGIGYDGSFLWRNTLSGFMNRDIRCADLDGDGSDEVLAANADGTLYCLDHNGANRWKFRTNDAPMGAVCVVRKDGVPHVVCGGYDKNLHYLSADGELVKTIASSTYSTLKPWGKPGEKRIPPTKTHIANFIRTVRTGGGMEAVLVHGTQYSNSSSGAVYLFEPLADRPFKTIKNLSGSGGDLTTCDINNDGVDEILFGASSMIQNAEIGWLDLQTDEHRILKPSALRRQIDGFGYRVAQSVEIGGPEQRRFLTSFGSRIIVSQTDLDPKNAEVIKVGYSFNDLWKDRKIGKILLAGTQTGGSCVHVVDTSQDGWKDAFAKFQPLGKLQAVLANTAKAREQLQKFQRPAHERAPRKVHMMTESLKGDLEKHARSLEAEFGSPVFLNSFHMGQAENWDRSELGNEKYEKRRDGRRRYDLSQEQALGMILPHYDTDRSGVAFWGGHGNDPYMFQTDTMRKIADHAVAKKKSSVFIYPELESYDDNFAFVLDHHIYPLADYFKTRDAKIYVRTKHTFWQSIIYKPLWSRLLSGELADVFIPSMEETADKSMELSVSARAGLWASGAVNQWGSRGARDNPSFDRLRQHSHQMVPNHFLRAQIYNISCGATYQNNFPVDQEYFSILYELIAKGALYVPERNEIVSFSPVHLGMTAPDNLYLDEGNNAKWVTFYDEQHESENPLVFSRLNGTWPGAPVTEWDFSRYAAGVKERRLNFLPPYENGLVLMTPPQIGVFADKNAPRGALRDKLHPIYKDILKEYISDGRDYISADGKARYPANEFSKTVEADIQASAKLLPLTVSGDVAWVAAQTSPTHLRLTLIDGGYINPSNRSATVTFHTAKPAKMTDLLDGTTFDVSNPTSVNVNVPCGLFRFLDIELKQPLP